MGYFCVPEGKESKDDLKACIRNIELAIESGDVENYLYLLEGFAMTCLTNAIGKIKQEME